MIKILATGAAALALCACTPKTEAPADAPAAPAASTAQVAAPASLSADILAQLNSEPAAGAARIAEVPEGILKSQDINGDGVTDWIVTWPDSAQFCGTGGCRVTVYLGVGDTPKRVFDRQVLDALKITRVEGETRIESSFHHGICDEKRDDCRLAWGLDTATNTLVARPSENGDTYSSSPDEGAIDATWGPVA